MPAEARHPTDPSGTLEYSCYGMTATLTSRRGEQEGVVELTSGRTIVHVSLEEVGGRTQIGSSRRQSEVAHGGAHASLVPAGVSAWEWFGPITLHRRLMIQFDLSSAPGLVRSNLEKSGPRWMTEDPAILQCSARLAHALEVGTHGRRFVSAIALAMIARFAELGSTFAVGGLSRERLRKAQDFLIGNLSADVTMSELAQRVGLSESHFVRAFKASTGLPPYRWQLKLRIDKAKSLILDGVALADVAAATGFASQSHLTRVFHDITGATPAEWRRIHRHDKPLASFASEKNWVS
ncbi:MULTISPECIES: helix-turn-helix domain-containing protein [Bradyrhizobium]|uniref:Transcriptional regulatory protein n=2 Tax=Nitrobacteraceae TaxID=41294 RepID=Q89MD9_BRADU|nr:AraC family transcriptional regulator [Bradyrhizobium diazoefficiens]PDT61198.1 AraC family transcriptional regulator [Bradyrhizobium diazoefficiens]QBP23021.1 AraC family transcriptional regulator [Bradyrhizobium diazoefficiens]WLB34319.1 AraC family transcriptional regulator [Bradyrhizobium diazoefficiens]BAC49519.1 transcriptional regulatory protein [Bradyrhizobium diazoefficiens USDA 110]BCA03892.1 AraC family transcriptional regulator [Bradyrhizobium diazoefficiens]